VSLGHMDRSWFSPTSVTTQPVPAPRLRGLIIPGTPAVEFSFSAALTGDSLHRSCTLLSQSGRRLWLGDAQANR
jgi:hypothetical protein